MSAEVPVAQEEDRVSRTKIVLVAVAGMITVVVSLLVAYVLPPGGATARSFRPTPPTAPRELGIVEQTQFATTARGYALQAEQREALSRYGWVDKDAGVARIPIDRAMDLIVERAK